MHYRRLVVVAIAALLAGCTQQAPIDPNPTDPGRAQTVAPIRSFDFDAATWTTYAVSGAARSLTEVKPREVTPREVTLREVTLRAGSATAGGITWTRPGTHDSLLFLDADDDGDEDALAAITATTGRHTETVWYFWLWDTNTARQLPVPIALDTTCGSTVEAITVAGRAAVFTERPGTNCPSLAGAAQRRVTVVDGAPVLEEGGFGGLCPAAQSGSRPSGQALPIDGVPAAGYLPLLVAPADTAAEVALDADTSLVPVDLRVAPWLRAPAWAAWYVVPRDGTGPVRCGFHRSVHDPAKLIPAGFPLDRGLAGADTSHPDPLRPITVCGRQVWPVTAVDAATVTSEGSSTRSRQLVTAPSEKVAVDALELIREVIAGCPADASSKPVTAATGYDSVTFAEAGQLFQFTRVGFGVLLVRAPAGTDPVDAGREATETSAAIAAEMCVFTNEGC